MRLSPERPWNIPYQRNSLFTGREHILERLAEALNTGETTTLAQPQAISGLGGIGKTQTAIEYAYRFRNKYQAVLWARADTRENLVLDYFAIARLLNLPEQHLQDQPRIVVKAVKQWLSEHSQWLLILDNADDLGMVRDFLPETHTGHILLTTRSKPMGGLARRIELDRMEQTEGTLFLLRRAGFLEADDLIDKASSQDQANALAIVQTMDGLPLALDQAGAYIEETGCGLAGYLTRYRQRRRELLKARGGYILDHPEPAATTWSLSFEKVEHANLAAADLLRFCAFLAPDAIPEKIVTEGDAELTTELQSLATDPFLLDTAVKELFRYSLIQRDAEQKLLSMHRLVQAVLKDAMNEEVQRAWAERAIRTVNRSFPSSEDKNLPPQTYLPHALMCASYIEQWDMAFPEAASVLFKAGCYLSDRGQYRQAEPLYQLAVRVGKQALGPDHPDVALLLSSLAKLYNELGKYEEAEPLYKRALRIREQKLGPDHPDVAKSLNDLANLYHELGKYEEAEPLYQQAIRVGEQALEPDHPDVAKPLNGLADLYREQGKYAEAEPLFQRAVHLREQARGSDLHRLAFPLIGLADLYREQGKYAEAEELYQRALDLRVQIQGLDHPDMAFPLVGLADLYREQGKYAEAEERYQHALCLREWVHGPEHPLVAYPLNGLADLYREQGKYADAEEHYQRALAIYEKALPDHPWLAIVLESYAALLRQMQRPTEAAALERRAKDIQAKRQS